MGLREQIRPRAPSSLRTAACDYISSLLGLGYVPFCGKSWILKIVTCCVCSGTVRKRVFSGNRSLFSAFLVIRPGNFALRYPASPLSSAPALASLDEWSKSAAHSETLLISSTIYVRHQVRHMARWTRLLGLHKHPLCRLGPAR